ncbi:hypothetical protein V6Z12_D05G420300 [Gossypium hirsutum]
MDQLSISDRRRRRRRSGRVSRRRGSHQKQQVTKIEATDTKKVDLSKRLTTFLSRTFNMVDHRQVHQQLKLWQSIFPEIKAVLNHAEEKQIKDEGVKNWLGDLQDLVYDADDILGEFTYQELRLKLQKTQAQANSSK